MNNNFVPYLCGGIFFSFLIETHKDTAKYLHNAWGAKENVLNQHEIMRKLILVIKPNYTYEGSTLVKDTSLYHSCQKVGDTIIIPFENEFTIEEFDKSVRNQYDEVLKRMTKFTAECFPKCTSTVMRHLVEKTLVLIRDDNSIKNDAPFFINENGSPISKKALLKQKEFCFQSFLVGIWHYILTKPTTNTDGRPTFEKIFSKDNNKKYKLDTRCFSNINITGREISKESTSKVNECQNIIETPKAVEEEKPEIKIYYTGGLLDDKEEHAILSFSPTIIDLNKNPDISIEDNPVSSIYKITTEFQFKTHFLSSTEEIIRLSCDIGSSTISGTTSLERWLSRSKLNNMRFRKKGACTAWFRLKKSNENEYDADFYIIGEIFQ